MQPAIYEMSGESLRKAAYGRVVLVIIAGLLIGVGALGGSPAAHAGASFPPLWGALPTRHFATLGQGVVGGQWWGMYVFRGQDRATPCIEEVHLSKRGQFGRVRSCGKVSNPAALNSHVYTVFGQAATWPDGSETASTEVGMLFPVEVVKSEFAFRPARRVVKRTHLLSSAQARKARIAPVRYSIVILAREVCLTRVQGWDGAGISVFNDDIDEDGCLNSVRSPHGS